jgi:hypothetical protein
VTASTVTGNNYTGQNEASSTGILAFGGCGSPLMEQARLIDNKLTIPGPGPYLAGKRLSGDRLAAEPDAARSQAEGPDERAFVVGVP